MTKSGIIGLLAVLIFNAGCPGDKSRPQGTTNRVGRGMGPTGGGQVAPPPGGTVIPQSPTGGTAIWGKITPQAGAITSSHSGINQNWPANDMSRWFLSSDFHPEEVGATTSDQDISYNKNCTPGQYCGVEFTVGRVSMNPSNLNQARSAGMVNIQAGLLTMAFWDSMVGLVDSDGVPYTPIPVYVNLTNQSYISNNRIVLNFQDAKGTIQFDGTLNGNQYSGVVNFQNTVNYAGTNDWATAGRLGTFQINACAIFQCQ